VEKIKAAIIGLGRIASILEEDTLREKPCTHSGAIAANEDCVLVCGCDIDEERRSLFAKKWLVNVYEDADEMLMRHKPEILSIATHPDSHYHYCRLAAKYNIPAVICEKPLADNIHNARKIAKIAEKGNTIIITNHERRYSLDYIRAKAVLEEKKLGEILRVHACLYMGKTARLIDQFWHDGTHLADAVMFLTEGVLKHRRAWGAKLTAKDGTAWLEGVLCLNSQSAQQSKHSTRPCGKKIPVLFETGAGRDHLVFEIEFSLEKGRLRIGNGVFEVWESVPSPYAEKFRSLKQTSETFSCPTGYFANMIKDAVLCVRDKSHKPVSGAVDGLRVIEYLNSVKSWR